MQTAMRSTRSAGVRAASALAESYAAMVSGVLVGLSQALTSGASDASANKAPAKKSAKRS